MRIVLPHHTVILLGIAVAFTLFGDMTLYVVLPVHYVNLNLSPLQVGILLSANRWIRIVTNRLAELTCRRFDNRFLFTGAIVTGCLVTLSYSLNPPFLLLLLARMVWGLCWSFIRQIGVMTSIGHAKGQSFAQVIGFYNAVVRCGFLVGTFFGGMLFDRLGYASVFRILALVSVIGIVAGLVALKGTIHTDLPAQPADHSNERSMRMMMKGFVVGCVGPGIIMASLGMILKSMLGASISLGAIAIGIATVNGFLLAVRQVLSIAGSPVLGTFADRMGLKKGELYFFLIAVVALLVATVMPQIWILLLTIIIFFICETTLRIVLVAEAGRLGSKQHALLATAMDFGAAFGPLFSWSAIGLISRPIVTLLLGCILYVVGAGFSLVSYKNIQNRS